LATPCNIQRQAARGLRVRDAASLARVGDRSPLEERERGARERRAKWRTGESEKRPLGGFRKTRASRELRRLPIILFSLSLKVLTQTVSIDRSLNGRVYEHGTGIRWCMPVWTKCIEVRCQVTRNGAATSCEDSTNLVYAHGASVPSIYRSIARSTVPLLGGLDVVCERGLWALERVVVGWWPQMQCRQLHVPMRFRIQTTGNDDSSHENGSFCWAVPYSVGRGDLKA
jgi:hypothetical protein